MLFGRLWRKSSVKNQPFIQAQYTLLNAKSHGAMRLWLSDNARAIKTWLVYLCFNSSDSFLSFECSSVSFVEKNRLKFQNAKLTSIVTYKRSTTTILMPVPMSLTVTRSPWSFWLPASSWDSLLFSSWSICRVCAVTDAASLSSSLMKHKMMTLPNWQADDICSNHK